MLKKAGIGLLALSQMYPGSSAANIVNKQSEPMKSRLLLGESSSSSHAQSRKRGRKPSKKRNKRRRKEKRERRKKRRRKKKKNSSSPPPTTQSPMTQAPPTRSPTNEAPPTRSPTNEASPTRCPTNEAPPTQSPTADCYGQIRATKECMWCSDYCSTLNITPAPTAPPFAPGGKRRRRLSAASDTTTSCASQNLGVHCDSDISPSEQFNDDSGQFCLCAGVYNPNADTRCEYEIHECFKSAVWSDRENPDQDCY